MFRITLAVSVLLLAAGCRDGSSSELALYDWEAQRAAAGAHGVTELDCEPQACPDPTAKMVNVFGDPKLTGDDVDRKTVGAGVDPQTEEPVVYAQFTPDGQRRFESLTRVLAHRGAEARKPQHLLLVVDNAVYAAPYIDYRFNPDGIPGDNGIQISGLASLGEARELAQALRRD